MEVSTKPGAIHNYASIDSQPSQVDSALITGLKNALNMIGTQILDHVAVGYEGCDIRQP